MRQVVLDTETTGLEPEQGHRVIEIGCVELVNRRKTGRKFHRYLRPDRLIDRAAQHVHGITDDFLAQQPRFADRSEEHTSELQSQSNLVCRLLLEKKNRGLAVAQLQVREL